MPSPPPEDTGTKTTRTLTFATLATPPPTVPQMNVLVLGFQVKTLLLLIVLPSAFGVGGALLTRMLALTLSPIPRLF